MPVRFRRVRGKTEAPPDLGAAESNGSHEEELEDEVAEGVEERKPAPAGKTDEQADAPPVDKPAEPAARKAPRPAASPGGLDLENALKELAARMTMLSSSVDGVKESRQEMEEKLGAVEERMMRLGALAEAVSSKYNPFIAENSPAEPSWKQAKEEAGAVEPLAPASPPPSAAAHAPSPPLHETHAQPAHTPLPELGSSRPPADALPAAVDALASRRGGAPETPRRPRAPEQHSMDPFEHNLMTLEWVGMMMRRVGRAGLMDLLEYYEGLGWLDHDLKSRALRVAVGVDAPDRAGDGNWRGDVDMHERSLLAIERLQGRNVSAARLDALRMDMRRIFGG